MIAFASLFLGLVVGVVPVTVLVEKPVAAIRLELDGRTVETRRQETLVPGVDEVWVEVEPDGRPGKDLSVSVAVAHDGTQGRSR